MFAYFQGSGSRTAAVDKELMNALIENSFIEEYHWTPAYIRTLPYKWIQQHLVIKKARRAAQEQQASVTQFHNSASNQQLKPGQKTYREV